MLPRTQIPGLRAPHRRRHGILLPELLSVLLVLVLIMSILAEAFSSGLTTFRRLKDVGDLPESLQQEAARLEVDLRSANELASQLIIDAWETGDFHQDDAAGLRILYVSLDGSIREVAQGLANFARQVEDPAGRETLERSLCALYELEGFVGLAIDGLQIIENGGFADEHDRHLWRPPFSAKRSWQ